MVWILLSLFGLIGWASWFLLALGLKVDLGIWIPIAFSALLAAIAVLLLVFRRVRARSAASALERAIAQQGARQAINARPERRAEIVELQKQIQGGINALKSSRMGGGKVRGAAALYSLPWYVIIGPPGAGKTTALKCSGMVFPFADPSGGGVRGVGGTRNCDWWFTNDAILLDTAGRYTTESEDRDEWIAFLSMLKKYRSRRPINGVIVAISVAELIDANDQQIDETAKKIRARIDEVMTQLHMVVPVYVLFTKCDLVAGFVEVFGDLRKSDRAQAWGSTLRLNLPREQPGQVFAAEFDLLTRRLHGRALKRLTQERVREARERIFEFPLEMAAVKRNLTELIGTMFMPNAFQGTPLLRGFYFTSGTQEGRPIDRVLGRMGHAMGIRPAEAKAAPVVESKSYFLHDVFTKIAFPDAEVAARSDGELRRQWLTRVAVSLSAFVLALLVAGPGVVSFFNNRAFLDEIEGRAKAAAQIQWADGRPATEKVAVLAPLLGLLVEIDDYRENGAPLSMGWPMYRGDDVQRSALNLYVSSLQQGFVLPCRQRLEERLKGAKGEPYLRERLDLKTYLMLSDVEHLDVEWATARLTGLWAEILRSTTSVAEIDLKKALAPHVRYYLGLLKARKTAPVPATADLVAHVRRVLMGVPIRKRYYDLFVHSVIDETYDGTGDAARGDRKFPPLSLGDLFADRPGVRKVLQGARFVKEKRHKEVEGPYTDKGHLQVVKNVTEGEGLLLREEWVVPLTNDERGDRVARSLAELADEYEQRYVGAWTDFLMDIVVTEPATVKEAVELYTTLTEPEWPYLRILRALEDHTQWRKSQSVLEGEGAAQILKQQETKVQQRLTSATGLKIEVDLKKIAGRLSTVPAAFKKVVEFGVVSGQAGNPADTPLAKYLSTLTSLRDDMQRMDDAGSTIDQRVLSERIADAAKGTETLLAPFDDKARTLLGPLLAAPLRVGGVSRGPVRRYPAPLRR